MKLSLLQEMLQLREVDKNPVATLAGQFKQGYNSAKQNSLRANQHVKNQETEDKAVNMQAVADDVTQYVQDFFDNFPSLPARGSAEDIVKRYPDKGLREAAMKAYTSVATRVEQLRKGLNDGMIKSNKLTKEQIRVIETKADQMSSPTANVQSLTRFVNGEKTFFKRLIKVNSTGALDDATFKQLLKLKIDATDDTRMKDAAAALNFLFSYMSAVFRDHADLIDEVASRTDAQQRQQRISQRDTQ